MCLEIIAKKSENYIIHYVPGVRCVTDPPLSLTDLLKQRRRWYNGSLFASLYVLTHMCKIWKRKRWTCFRNFGLMILYAYLIIQVFLTYIIVGVFYAIFSIFLREILPSSKCLSVESAANVIENFLVVSLFAIVVLSHTTNIKNVENGFYFFSMVFGVLTLVLVAGSIFFAFDGAIDTLGVFFILIFLLSYIVPFILN